MGFVFGYRTVSSFTKQPLSFVFGWLPAFSSTRGTCTTEPVYIEILQQGMLHFYSKRVCVSWPGLYSAARPFSSLGQSYCCAEKRMPNYLKHSFCDQQRTTRHSWSECCVVLWRSSIVVTRPDTSCPVIRSLITSDVIVYLVRLLRAALRFRSYVPWLKLDKAPAIRAKVCTLLRALLIRPWFHVSL